MSIMFRLDGQRSSAQTWLWSAQTVDEECLALPNPHSCQLKHNRASTQSPKHRDSQHTQSSESHPLVPLINQYTRSEQMARHEHPIKCSHSRPPRYQKKKKKKTIFAPRTGSDEVGRREIHIRWPTGQGAICANVSQYLDLHWTGSS